MDNRACVTTSGTPLRTSPLLGNTFLCGQVWTGQEGHHLLGERLRGKRLGKVCSSGLGPQMPPLGDRSGSQSVHSLGCSLPTAAGCLHGQSQRVRTCESVGPPHPRLSMHKLSPIHCPQGQGPQRGVSLGGENGVSQKSLLLAICLPAHLPDAVSRV